MFKSFLSFSVFVALFLLFSTSTLAASATEGIYNPVQFTSLGEVITKALPIVFGLAGFVAVIFFSIGAVKFIASRGDAKAVDSARNTMTGAVVGLVIVLGAAGLSGVFERTFGLGLFGAPSSSGVGDTVKLDCAIRINEGICLGARYSNFGEFVTQILQLIVGAGAVIFFFILLWSGIRYMLSRGDEKAASEARSSLGNAFVGFLLLLAGYIIIRLISAVVFNIWDVFGS